MNIGHDFKDFFFRKKVFFYFLVFFLSIVWTLITARYLIDIWGWKAGSYAAVTMRISQLVSVPVLSGIFFYIFEGRLEKRSFLIFLFYSAWFLLLFFSLAPGCFTEDSLYTLHMVKNGWWAGWYSAFHPLLMTALMQIIPSEYFAPGVFLALLWGVVFANIHGVLFLLGARKVFHFLIPLLIFSPALIAASLVIVRDSFFCAFFLMFLILVFKATVAKNSLYGSKFLFFGVALLSGVLVVYRVDAVPSVILGWIFICFNNRSYFSPANFRPSFAACCVAPIVLLFILVSSIPHVLDRQWVKGNTWDSRAEREYKLTLIENPLGFIFKHANGNIADKERNSIEKVFKISDLTKNYCAENICVFYGGLWNRESTKEERNAAFSSALKIFLSHPGYFMLSRIATLNTVGNKNTQTSCDRKIMEERGYPPFKFNGFMDRLGSTMLGLIHRTETSDGALGGSGVWWNVYFYLFFCVIVVLRFTKAPAAAFIAFLLLVRTVVVIIAAPAGFSIYYLPLFFGVPLTVLFMVLEIKKGMVNKV